jgi:hypothetical protein
MQSPLQFVMSAVSITTLPAFALCIFMLQSEQLSHSVLTASTDGINTSIKTTSANISPNFSVPFRIFIVSYVPYFSFLPLAFLSCVVQHKGLFGVLKIN